MGGATFVKNRADLRFAPVADQPPLRSGGRFFIKPRAKKESNFRSALGLVYFFFIFFSILRSCDSLHIEELNVKDNINVHQHIRGGDIALVENVDHPVKWI